MRTGAADPGVFIRSMATRERLGGIADATYPSVILLAAAFDRVFIETVGVGQSESEVARISDTVVYVAQPGAGDIVQYMKAGVLELPDVLVVNKADRGAEAERTASEIAAAFGLSERDAAGWTPPVILASALEGRGLDELTGALERHRRHLEASGALRQRRLRARETYVLEALTRRYGSFGLDRLGGPDTVTARLRAPDAPSAFALVQTLSTEIESDLRGPR